MVGSVYVNPRKVMFPSSLKSITIQFTNGFVCHFFAMKYLKVIAVNLAGQDNVDKNIFLEK